MKESALQRKIALELSKQRNLFSVKYHGGPFTVPGFPDRIIMGSHYCHNCGFPVHSKVWLAEVKTETGTVSPLQAKLIADLKNRRINVGVVRSVEEALNLVDTSD